MSNVTDEIQAFQAQIQDELKNKAELEKLTDTISQIHQMIRAKANDIEKEQVRIETIRKNLKEDMTSRTLGELEDLLREFETTVEVTQMELQESQKYARELQKSIASSQNRQMELTQRKGVLLKASLLVKIVKWS